MRATPVAPLPSNVFTNRPQQRVDAPISPTVVLLDGVNTRLIDQLWARKQFLQFLTQIQPRDRIAVYGLGRQLHILYNFTTDASLLLAAAQRYSGQLGDFHGASAEPVKTGDASFDAIANSFQDMQADPEIERRVDLTVEAMEAVAIS